MLMNNKNESNSSLSRLQEDDDDSCIGTKKEPMNAEFQSLIFPKRLMAVLADEANQDAISWLPDGRAFTIVNHDIFLETVMPKFSTRKSKFSSFLRKLNRWGFSRVSKGPTAGAYRHDFFVRDKPQLAAQMYYHNKRTREALKSDVVRPAPLEKTALMEVLDSSQSNKESIYLRDTQGSRLQQHPSDALWLQHHARLTPTEKSILFGSYDMTELTNNPRTLPTSNYFYGPGHVAPTGGMESMLGSFQRNMLPAFATPFQNMAAQQYQQQQQQLGVSRLAHCAQRNVPLPYPSQTQNIPQETHSMPPQTRSTTP